MKIFLFIIISFCVLSGNAQTRYTGWLASFNTFKLDKKKSIHADVQLRSTDELAQVQTLLLRTGMNFHLNKKLTVTLGYAYISNKTIIQNIAGFVPEHRIWEQLLYNHKWSSLFVSHRLRLEQRFLSVNKINNNEIETDKFTMSHRFRYFLRNVLPLRKTETFKKGTFAALQNEVFVNVGNKDKVNGKFFDQNRLYLAIGYRLNPAFDLEAGYLNQYVLGKTSRVNNHVGQLAAYLRL